MNKQEILQELYKNHSYTCEVPPVCSGNWNSQNWVDWILKTGKFNFKKELNAFKNCFVII